MPDIICAICGEKFHVPKSAAERSNIKHCSNKCRWLAKNPPKECEWCGETFKPTHSSRFCSRKCYRDFVSANRSRVVCEWCGGEFIVQKSWAKSRKFCSRECFGKWYSESMSGEDNPMYIDRAECTCAICGATFYKYESHVRKGRGITCSIECCSIYRSKNYSGKNSHAWKGGKSFDPYPIIFNGEFKRMIRERDGFRCMACGKSEEGNGRKLCVHHVDYDKDNTTPENCVSLCLSCHSKSTHQDRVWWQEMLSSALIQG